MLTPGNRKVPVNIISLKHPVRQAGKRFDVPLVDASGIRFLSECGKERVDHKKDCMYLWTGDRGAGKSTGIIQTCLTIDPHLTTESICFKLDEFGEKFTSNPQGDGSKGVYPQIIMDEAGHALYGPQWLAREQLEIAKNMIINRIMRQILHVAVPKRKQFNNQIRDMAFIWVHISEPREYVQGYGVVRLAPVDLQSEFHSEKYWIPKMAFIYPELTGELWDAYEAKKIAFVKEASKDMGKAGTKSARFIAARDAVMREYHEYRKARGDPISLEKLGAIVGLKPTQTWDIINQTSN